MNHPEWRRLACSLLAVAVPAAALHFAADPARHAAGLTAAPFGWPQLLLAHLATALPLAWLAAGLLGASASLRNVPALAWVTIGALAAAAGAALGPVLGEVVVGLNAGVVVALAVRTPTAFALVLPWCLAARPGAVGFSPLAFGVAVAVATVPCGLAAEAVVTAQTAHLQDLHARERLARAATMLDGLVELASDRSVAGTPPRQLVGKLARSLEAARQSVKRDLPARATARDRVERAVLLIRLDRLDDAKAQLEAVSPRDNLTTLLLATVERDLGRLDASTALLAGVWEESLPRAAADAQAKADCLTALNGLLSNSRESGRPEEAEPLLRRGLEALPAEAAFFHLQLGKHDAEAGRAESSAAHLKRAAELDPARYGAEADAILSQSRARTLGCQLRAPGP